MRGQIRRLMANCGQIDPENIDHALAQGAYEGFVKALDMEPEAIIALMLESGLGRTRRRRLPRRAEVGLPP